MSKYVCPTWEVKIKLDQLKYLEIGVHAVEFVASGERRVTRTHVVLCGNKKWLRLIF